MKLKIWEAYVYPALLMAAGMFWGAWYSGVKWHTPLSSAWLKAVFMAPLPLWLFLVALAFGSVLGLLYRRSRLELSSIRAAEETKRTEAEAANEEQHQRNMDIITAPHREMMVTPIRPARPEPRLEAVWEESYWGEDTVEGQPAIYLSGWAFFSMHNGASACVLVQASVNGSEAVSIPPVDIGGRNGRRQFFTDVVPPIGTRGEPLQATITLTDTRNQKYTLTERVFRWSDSPGDS